MNESIWLKDKVYNPYPELIEDIKTTVAVIGGGITGILTSFFLNSIGIDCVLIEANKIYSGVTENTTAKITSQHSLIYSNLIKNFGKEKAHKYFCANQNAIQEYVNLCKNIDCDLEITPSFVYSINDKFKIEEEVQAVNSIGGNAKFLDKIEIPIKISGAIKFEDQAQFNPIKFLNNISKGLRIFENTMAISIEGNTVITKMAKISAEKIIVASHFPFINKHGLYFMKMYQQRSYVLGIKNTPKISGMYIDESSNGLSFRGYKDILFVGGCGNRTGKNHGGYQELRSITKKLYPKCKEIYAWAAQDCMTLDGIPYVGKYSKNSDNIFVATGFNKWGMTSSMLSSKILVDMVSEKSNEYKDVFSPQRMTINKQLLINAGESTKNLLTPTKKRCSHLGCALKYNDEEGSWDCPCHGSRFSESGKLINNPALRDIHKK